MLSTRTEKILKSIVGQYITKAMPVPSQNITKDNNLAVSSATIRNEMAILEQEGYITRSHPSAGSVPSDKGYRWYVETLDNIKLPNTEQRMISHLFHQVEKELNEWLNLGASLTAQMVQNAAVVTMPKPKSSKFKYLELVSLQDIMALVVIILDGAHLRQQLITFGQVISQNELTAIANKLRTTYSGLTKSQISSKNNKLSSIEQQITGCIVEVMEDEDEHEYEEQYLNGLHYMLNQPEFTHNQRMLNLIALMEQHVLLKSIVPPKMGSGKVQVIIGGENKEEAIHDYSVVISHYGLPEEAEGTIGVIGPTRMPYARTIATVAYLSSVLSELVTKLYDKDSNSHTETNINN
ncbi:heat-inducible transcriptional repressor HrcA [Chloroflexota bacterium]